ncbi:hypothetical protein ABLT31_28235 [Ammoniphilus sp. 3BR4]
MVLLKNITVLVILLIFLGLGYTIFQQSRIISETEAKEIALDYARKHTNHDFMPLKSIKQFHVRIRFSTEVRQAATKKWTRHLKNRKELILQQVRQGHN